ncbi:hypothetical protein X471_00275 [Bartonella bacilliformis str. Heidi Mejia]|nr:hypothetical protein X471_00275 [Bartonella bacilliformis str. Heidi Mejia]KEG18934.1 hypothetical protein H707_00672 [Bartonella bacilliformis Hosp800-02]KEG24391.1 hypothetical protein H706_00682 [Bartonella bacilliformis CAR600-02]
MVGKMAKRESNRSKSVELTESEKELLQEMMSTYQGMKLMSRLTRWIVLIVFLLVLDLERLLNALDTLKQWLARN